MPVHKKKRLFEMGKPATLTKLGARKIIYIKGRGANYKQRALRNDQGNYTWASEQITRKTKVVDVVYNATNNELVKTKTLVKNTIVQIDATPFKAWYLQHYGIELGKKKAGKDGEEVEETVKKSKHVLAKQAARSKDRVIDQRVADQLARGRLLLACISSRPGQSGRVDGYILEGKELEFYSKQMSQKKRK